MKICKRKRLIVFFLALLLLLIAYQEMKYISMVGDEIEKETKVRGSRLATTATDTIGTTSNNVKTILFWGNFYDKSWSDYIQLGIHECSGYKCTFSADPVDYPLASAVVFHGAARGNLTSVPDVTIRPMSQRWVFHNMDASYNPSFKANHLKRMFNWTHTYLRNSDLRNNRGTTVPGVSFKGFKSQKDYLQNRTKMMLTFINDCSGHKLRFIQKLEKHIHHKIDVFGNSPCSKKQCLLNTKGCQKKILNYKFLLILDGKICKDYHTDLIYQVAYKYQLIPVIVSGINHSDHHIIPPRSYINAFNFKSMKMLGNHLRNIASNRKLYNQFFRWHSHFKIERSKYLSSNKHFNSVKNFCNLCKALHENNRHLYKYYKNIIKWFETQNSCKPQYYNLHVRWSKIHTAIKGH